MLITNKSPSGFRLPTPSHTYLIGILAHISFSRSVALPMGSFHRKGFTPSSSDLSTATMSKKGGSEAISLDGSRTRICNENYQKDRYVFLNYSW